MDEARDNAGFPVVGVVVGVIGVVAPLLWAIVVVGVGVVDEDVAIVIIAASAMAAPGLGLVALIPMAFSAWAFRRTTGSARLGAGALVAANAAVAIGWFGLGLAMWGGLLALGAKNGF